MKSLVHKKEYIDKKASFLRDEVKYLLGPGVLSYSRAKYIKSEIDRKSNFREAFRSPSPKSLSVVTVNYNNASGLSETLRSVFRQTIFRDIEVIVIDAASSDGSLTVINENIEGIDVAISSPDNGVYDGMNRGIEFCSSDFVLFLNSGDCFDGDDVAEQILKNVNGESSLFLFSTRLPTGSVWEPISYEHFWKAMPACHQSMVFNWRFLQKEKYNLSYHIAADYDLFARALANGRVTIIPQLVVACIEPVGISSDFKERTIERWRIARRNLSPLFGLSQIDHFYGSYLLTDGSVPPLKYKSCSFPNVDSDVESNIIFLISMPRSGSTLLQRILDSCPSIQSAGEPWVMLPLLSMYDDKLNDTKYGQHLNIMAANEFESYLDKQNLITESQRAYALKLYSEVLDSVCKDGEYFLDKTPRYVHIVEELSKLLPKAKFICLKRNPAAVISSYAHTWNQGNYSTLLDDKYYKFDFEHGFKSLADFSVSSFENKIVINYEDLVVSPEKTVKELFSFLNLQFDESVIQYKKPKSKYKFGDPSSVYEKSRPDSSGAKKYLDNVRSIEDSFHLVKILSKIEERTFSDLGYEKSDVISEVYEKQPYSIPPLKHVENLIGFKSKDAPSSEKLCDVDLSVGVVITCFNNEVSIYQALQSVVNQTFPPTEIIVVDDASTDRSVVEIERFFGDYPDLNLIFLKNQNNLGVSRSRDKAIRYSKSQYISTLDGDDIFHEEKLHRELSMVIETGCPVAFSDIVLLSDEGKAHRLDTTGYHRISIEEGLEALIERKISVPRDLTFKRSLYFSACGFDLDLNLYEDWALKQRLMKVAGDFNWIHSGGIGTIYDRRNPGLSRKHPLVLVYGQMLVLGRNADMLFDLKLGPLIQSILILCRSLSLEEKLKNRIENFLKSIDVSKNQALLFSRLEILWRNRLSSPTTKEAGEQLWKFSKIELPQEGYSSGKRTIYVVTPVLNGVKYIQNMLLSVANQHDGFDIVHHVQDGGSTDGTIEVLEEHSRFIESSTKYAHVTFTFSSDSDQGMYDSLGKGFKRLISRIKPDDWVTWINCDDYFNEGAFRSVVEVAKSNPQLEWLSGNCSIMDLQLSEQKEFFRPVNADIIAEGLADGINWPFLQQEGTFVRGNLWHKAMREGWLRSDLKYAGDWFLWYKLAHYSELYLIEKALATFCVHEDQMSKKHRSKYDAEVNSIINLSERSRRFQNFPVQRSKMYKYKSDSKDGFILVKANVLGAFAAGLY